MSLASLIYLGALWCCYRLGEFNARHPGESWRRLAQWWAWLVEWLKNSN